MTVTVHPVRAFLGIFGVTSFGVSQRMREAGVRLAMTVAILLGAAVLAVLGPARRAARVDPVAFLRQG